MSRIHSYDDSKVSFYYVKERAENASSKDGKTFESLIAYFRRWLDKTNADHRELQLVAGILNWIARNANRIHQGNMQYNTPLGLVKAFVERRQSGSEMLSQFFSHANIEYECILGRAKAVRYRAGDPDSDYLRSGHSWMAFKVDGKWHLLHPNWVIHRIVGFAHGDELKVEVAGVAKIKHEQQNDGMSSYGFNDFWFCTRPDIFVNRCFPNDPSWQSPNSRTPIVNSVNEYLELPDLRSGFYTMSLSLLGEKKCVLTSDNGRCQIVLKAEDKNAKRIDFSYELVLQDTDNEQFDPSTMMQLVLPQYRDTATFVFEVRLPVVGMYWLRISAGYFDSPGKFKSNCCAFKIKCTKALENCHLYPSSHGLGMFGHGPTAEDAGLTCPSVPGSKLKVTPNCNKFETVQTFVNEENVEVEASVTGSDSEDLKDCARTVIDEDLNKIQLQIKMPKDKGECSLVVSTKGQKDKKPKAAAVYLLTTLNEDENDKKLNKDIKEQEKKHRLEECIRRKVVEIEQHQDRVTGLEQEIETLTKALENMPSK